MIFSETKHQFNAKESDWGFHTFILFAGLYKPNTGFIVNDTCIIEAEILVTKLKQEDQVDQPQNKINDQPTKHIDTPLPKEIFTTFAELVDLMGLGKIE